MDSIYSKMMMSLQNKSLNEDVEEIVNDVKDETEVPAEGTVTDVVAVVDPDLSSDDYEKVIEKAEEVIEGTPEGEQPTDEQYIGQNIYTCPICGNAFFADIELSEGDACPVCSEVPEAFIFNGKVEGGITEEDEEMIDEMEAAVENEEIPAEEGTEEMVEEPVEEVEPEAELEPQIEEEEDEAKHESLETETTSTRLDEVRRVEKKRIVVAYDFSELSDEIKENLIARFKKQNGITNDSTFEDIIKNDTNSELARRLSKVNFINKEKLSPNIFYTYYKVENGNKERALKEMLNYQTLPYEIELKDLSPDLVAEPMKDWDGNETERTSIKFNEDLGGYSGFKEVAIKNLYGLTNYPELPKATKKEILAKINGFVEEVTKIYEEIIDLYLANLEKNTDSISELKALKDRPVVAELSKNWFTEDGIKICSKDKAKVVQTEALLTEAPVNLEFDDSFDVYTYDELDDRAKDRAFNDKKHLANNLYGKRWPALREKIQQHVEEFIEKAGVEVSGINVGDEVIYVSINKEGLVKYCQENGIDLEGMAEDCNPNVQVRIAMVPGYGYGNKFQVEVYDLKVSDEYDENSKKRREISEEIKMDLEGIYNQLQRIIKQAHEEAENDYRDKLSKQRKEYTADGREYKEK